MADGMPTGTQILLYTDSLAGLLKSAYAFFGLGNPGESGTLASLALAKKTAILGDGVSSYGLGAPAWQSAVAGSLSGLAARCRYDLFFSQQVQPLMTQLDNLVKNNLPTGWQYRSTPTQAHAFDMELMRKNAISSSTPVTPTLNGTLTATNDATGTLPNFLLVNCPRIVFTLVGALDYIESLPSPECPQVALTGANDAFLLTLPGSVPSGVFKIRIYRTFVGGAAGFYMWDQDVVVTPGAAFPTIKITDADATLRPDINPPAWMSAMLTPEAAAVFGLSFASSSVSTNALGFGLSGSTAPSSLTFTAANMLSPSNVLAGASSGFVGMGNQPGNVQFGTSTVTAANTQTYSAGALQAVNVPSNNIQGYAGSTGFQARVTTALNGSCTPSISYTYLNAANGQTVQNGSLTGSAFSGTAVGSLSAFTVPAGQLVLSVTVTSVSGAATSGAFLIEPTIRAY